MCSFTIEEGFKTPSQIAHIISFPFVFDSFQTKPGKGQSHPPRGAQSTRLPTVWGSRMGVMMAGAGRCPEMCRPEVGKVGFSVSPPRAPGEHGDEPRHAVADERGEFSKIHFYHFLGGPKKVKSDSAFFICMPRKIS